MDLWKMYNVVNSSTVGRDSLFRLVQYSSRLVHSVLEERECSIESVNKYKNVESSFSLARKFLRLFRVLEVLDKALVSLSIPDSVVRVTTSFSYLNTCLYYITDHVVWLGRIGVGNIDNPKWTKLNNKFWFVSVVMNLTRLLYQLRVLLTKDFLTSIARPGADVTADVIYRGFVDFVSHNRTLILDLVKNLCDFFMSMALLGRLQLKGRTIGALGVLSSVITILFVLKLKP